jgi:hypothetical protein
MKPRVPLRRAPEDKEKKTPKPVKPETRSAKYGTWLSKFLEKQDAPQD